MVIVRSLVCKSVIKIEYKPTINKKKYLYNNNTFFASSYYYGHLKQSNNNALFVLIKTIKIRYNKNWPEFVLSMSHGMVQTNVAISALFRYKKCTFLSRNMFGYD